MYCTVIVAHSCEEQRKEGFLSINYLLMERARLKLMHYAGFSMCLDVIHVWPLFSSWNLESNSVFPPRIGGVNRLLTYII